MVDEGSSALLVFLNDMTKYLREAAKEGRRRAV